MSSILDQFKTSKNTILIPIDDESLNTNENISPVNRLFWLDSFSSIKYQTSYFITEHGKELETPFISQLSIGEYVNSLYFKNNKYQAIRIPFEDRNYFFEVYLPLGKNSLDTIIEEDFFDEIPKFGLVKQLGILLPLINFNYEFDSTGVNGNFSRQNNNIKLDTLGVEIPSAKALNPEVNDILTVNEKEEVDYPFIDDRIWFKATSPFLFLIREAESNKVISTGTFCSPNYQHELPKIQHYIFESQRYLNNTFDIPYHSGFALGAYTLKTLIKHFNIERDEINRCINLFWSLSKNKNLAILLKEYEKIELTYRMESINSTLAITLIDLCTQIGHILRAMLNPIDSNGLRSSPLTSLIKQCINTLNHFALPIPNYDLIISSKRTFENPWGNIVEKIETNTFVKIEPHNISESYVQLRKRYQVILDFQTKILDIPFIDLLYLSLDCLERLIEKHPAFSQEIRTWILDIYESTPERKFKHDELEKLAVFDDFLVTGSQHQSKYMTNDELVFLHNTHPQTFKAITLVNSLISQHFYFVNKNRLTNPNLTNIYLLLDLILQENIELPDLENL